MLLTITLKCFQDNLSESGVKELLHLIILLLNSSSKNYVHIVTSLFGIPSNKSRLT